MKSVTEFWNVTLQKGLSAKTALAAEGKTPEEISQNLGETFKMEGDKLKHFINAIEVANQNQDKLMRVMVVSLNEGESAPAKAIQVEDFHYVPDFQTAPKPVVTQRPTPQGGRGRGGKKDGGKRA
jgi:hypothetical protein